MKPVIEEHLYAVDPSVGWMLSLLVIIGLALVVGFDIYMRKKEPRRKR